MENNNVGEQRKHPRTLELEVSCLSTGSLNESGGATKVIRGQCRDISVGGISFYASAVCQNQRDSVLRLYLPLDESNMKVMGKVAWSRKSSTASFIITGVQFLNIYEQDYRMLCD